MIRVGVADQLILAPLLAGLKRSAGSASCEFTAQTSEQNCRDLLQDRLDIAAVSAIDYARHSSELKIVKDISVCTSGISQYALLFFKENLQDIKNVAVVSPDTQYHILARMILNEFFGLDIDWIVSKKEPGVLDDVLDTYPACLFEKDHAILGLSKSECYLDIIEEWWDKTELCYTHQLMVVKKGIRKVDCMEALLESREWGMQNLMMIAKDYSAQTKLSWDLYFELLNEHFSFYSDVETWDALREYYEYLFYYGFIEYIPGIHFC